MRTSLVLTLIGDDRPGIVEQLAERVLATGANWEESRMARLAGKFAGLLRVTVAADQAESLAAALRQLDAGGLSIAVASSEEPPPIAYRFVRLALIGNDHPGIVRDISRALAEHRVNIEELETDVTSAPMSGETLFRARVTLGIPADVTIDQLRSALEALAGELMVDLEFNDDSAPPRGGPHFA
jgi:glycine cleavage system regulatory protein